MEKVTEIKAVRVRQMCEQPGCDGEMLPEHYVIASYPPIYPHRCNKCGCYAEYDINYPTIRYIEINNNQD